jgi:hypothetical protein
MKPLSMLAALALATVARAALGAISINVTPALPQYGQSVAVGVATAPAPLYLPATRYTRSGSTFTIDYEFLATQFGPLGPTIGMPQFSLGELAPGNYTLVARLIDIDHPGVPAQITTMNVAVVPPQDWGVYLVPSQPRANDAVEVVVRSAAYFDPSTLEATVSGNVVRVDFAYRPTAPVGGAVPPGMTSFASVKVGRLPPGAYRAEGWGHPDTGGDPQRYFTRDFSVGTEATVVEFYQEQLDHYFMSVSGSEIDLLDAGGQGGWKRTGQSFHGWLEQQDAPPGAHPVCRFYAAGANSHFYTGDDAECAWLKSLEQSQRADANARGERFLGWAYEGVAFWALVPQNGQCPPGTDPVWRAFNDRVAEDDMNHRFMVDSRQRAAMQGWTDEGAAFCSPH